jgi:hypothetical protein
MKRKCIQEVIDHLENDSKQVWADALCDFFPNVSRFQIHARIFKEEMTGGLAKYIKKALEAGE